MTRKSSEAGFTLLEVMATMVCITVLAAVATPRLSGYLRESRLQAAKPYLAQIAARERMYKIESGQYCCTTSGLSENNLMAGLGVTLADDGDFCFVFICQSTTLCQSVSGPGFVSTAGSAPDFEVWAILQNKAGSADPGPSGTVCTPATGKAAGTGFVAAASSTGAGRGGQVVVLRYPPPANGLGADGIYHAVPMDWRDGITVSDAMSP